MNTAAKHASDTSVCWILKRSLVGFRSCIMGQVAHACGNIASLPLDCAEDKIRRACEVAMAKPRQGWWKEERVPSMWCPRAAALIDVEQAGHELRTATSLVLRGWRRWRTARPEHSEGGSN